MNFKRDVPPHHKRRGLPVEHRRQERLPIPRAVDASIARFPHRGECEVAGDAVAPRERIVERDAIAQAR